MYERTKRNTSDIRERGPQGRYGRAVFASTVRTVTKRLHESSRRANAGNTDSEWPSPILAPDPTESNGWMRYAVPLADFFIRWSVRRDVFGGYKREEHREPDTPNSYTRPGKARRGAIMLDEALLRRHFIGADVGDVIGLHAVSPEGADGIARWFGLDLDAHGEVAPEYRESLRIAAMWCAEVVGERASVLLEDSNGRGGFHLWAYFDAPVSSAALYAWLRSIARQCHEATGILPETYPKQSRVNADEFGSWLRLPGRHHTRLHFSRVSRPGMPWYAGEHAARLILDDFPATPADAIPPLYAWPAAPVSAAATPRQIISSVADAPPRRAAMICAYVNRLPHGGAGTERSNKLFALARFLRHGMHCTSEEALPVLRSWDAGNSPPLGDAKVQITWLNAERYASRPLMLRAPEVYRDAA